MRGYIVNAGATYNLKFSNEKHRLQRLKTIKKIFDGN